MRPTRLNRIAISLFLAAAVVSPSPTAATRAPDETAIGPDSEVHPGVPRGEVTHYTFTSKGVYPGSTHDYWIYVPKQVDPAKPACLMVFQDGGGFQDNGGGFRVPIVFDNLINRGDMPPTIAVMVNPGVLPAANANALPRYNRSCEYDDLSDKYARFLLDELLPEVSKRVNITSDPNGRAICGASSGGICAFTAAWQRPDSFRRVMSFVGSFTDLRGGNSYASLIRKTEPKPLRVLLQDGTHDQDIYSGNWYIGNQDVAAALKFGGYDVKFVVGEGGHSGAHGRAILPDALRWLWRDYPKPIESASATSQPVMEVLIGGERWQPVGGADGITTNLSADSGGNVYFGRGPRILRMDAEARLVPAMPVTPPIETLTLGADGRIIVGRPNALGHGAVSLLGAKGVEKELLRNCRATAMVCDSKGNLYAGDLIGQCIWRIDAAGKAKKVAESLPNISGLALSPDQTLLIVNQSMPGKYARSYQVQQDGSLAAGQDFFDLVMPYGAGMAGARQMTTDTEGRLYVASGAGIQVCDQAGRVTGIIENPAHLPATAIAFGGPGLDTLYAVCGGRLYARKTKAKGALPFESPIKPPPPRL